MAFGRQKSQEAGAGESNAVPEEESRVVVEAATRAGEAGRRIFTGAVTVGSRQGAGWGLGARRQPGPTAGIQRQ
jgi:hypothetical protein